MFEKVKLLKNYGNVLAGSYVQTTSATKAKLIEGGYIASKQEKAIVETKEEKRHEQETKTDINLPIMDTENRPVEKGKTVKRPRRKKSR